MNTYYYEMFVGFSRRYKKNVNDVSNNHLNDTFMNIWNV